MLPSPALQQVVQGNVGGGYHSGSVVHTVHYAALSPMLARVSPNGPMAVEQPKVHDVVIAPPAKPTVATAEPADATGAGPRADISAEDMDVHYCAVAETTHALGGVCGSESLATACKHVDGSCVRSHPALPCPAADESPVAPAVRVAAATAAHRPGGLTMVFPATVAGAKVNVRVTQRDPRALVDSGASESFIDADFVARSGLATRSVPPVTIEMADGSEQPASRQCTVTLVVCGVKIPVTCFVAPLSPAFSIVLGDSWLSANRVVMDYGQRTCTFWRAGRRHVLRVPAPPPPSRVPPRVWMSAVQVKRAARKHAYVFLAQVSVGGAGKSAVLDRDEEEDAPHGGMPLPASVPAPIRAVVESYMDVFTPLSGRRPGLPPDRGVSHAIPLLPGPAAPPFRANTRLSPAERDEVTKQVADLLSGGLIEPAASPYGAPVLFVKKKDGTIRFCLDFRALNAQTVRNRYPLPRIDDVLDSLGGASVFSSIDLQGAYHQVRIPPEDIPKTAFVTPQGQYQWRVLPFGLTNAPSTFQALMNSLFGQYVGKFVQVYLDDILVYSKSLAEHEQHLRVVLGLLRQHQWHAKLSKCEFVAPQLKFLGHIISAAGVRPDPDKVKALTEWQLPQTITNLRAFIGLATVFKRFVQGFAKLSTPLTDLLKGAPGPRQRPAWTPESERAFGDCKAAMMHELLLATPDFSLPFEIVADASDCAIGAVLMQQGRPIAFESRKLKPAELNYTVGDKELLAVVHALRVWRCYVEGRVAVLVTDHHPNTYLKTLRDLSRRQARWLEFLESFEYMWQYRPGRINVADPLSRMHLAVLTRTGGVPRVRWTRDGRAHDEAPAATLTTPPPAPAGRPTVGQEPPPPPPAAPPPATAATTASPSPPPPAQGLPDPDEYEPAVGGMGVGGELGEQAQQDPAMDAHAQPRGGLTDRIAEACQRDAWFRNPQNLAGLEKAPSGLWYRDDKLVIPDDPTIKQDILFELHDAALAGHVGEARTLEAVRRAYWWPRLATDVAEYVQTCHACQRNKSSTQRPAGLLQPLQIPGRRWESVSMDLIVELPLTRSHHDAIVVFVDRLTKMVHFAATTTSVSARELASLYVAHVFRLHGMQASIVSDRDTRINSHFWREVQRLLGTKQSMSTAYHPQTDGQTERANRVLEDMLRHYVSGRQDDWDELLPAAEFAVNNAFQASTRTTPFMLNYGQHPLTPLSLVFPSSRVPAAKEFAEGMQAALRDAKQWLQAAQDRQKSYADQKRRDIIFKVGEEVLLKTSNIRLRGPGSRKLMPKWIGPFTVTKCVGPVAVRLALPETMRRVHPVFHVSMVKHYHAGGRLQPPPPPTVMDDGGLSYDVERILMHRWVRSGKAAKLEYLVRWEGYGPEHDSWEPEAELAHNIMLPPYLDSVDVTRDKPTVTRKRGKASARPMAG